MDNCEDILDSSDLETNQDAKQAVVQIVVQPTQLEVIVTDRDQSTVTFNKDQAHM